MRSVFDRSSLRHLSHCSQSPSILNKSYLSSNIFIRLKDKTQKGGLGKIQENSCEKEKKTTNRVSPIGFMLKLLSYKIVFLLLGKFTKAEIGKVAFA